MKRDCIHRAALAILATAGVALAQPANNSCSAPRAIQSQAGYTFNNVLATTDGLPHGLCTSGGSTQIYNDLWYCCQVSVTGPVRVSTCSQTTLDTRIAVYAGCTPCPSAGGILSCGDNTCGLQTEVWFNGIAGQSYLIRIGTTSPGQFGNGTFEVGRPSCYANCDGSTGAPILTGNDFQCFLDRFAAGNPYANCDGSTGTPSLTGNDFQCFLDRFAVGCS